MKARAILAVAVALAAAGAATAEGPTELRTGAETGAMAHLPAIAGDYFALDSRAYEDGALPVKTKELLGLVASLVLRCDDCVTYHIVRCQEEGVTREEFFETFNVALVVGGSITIPHLRRAVATLDEVEALQ